MNAHKRLETLQAEHAKFTREEAGLEAQLAGIRAGLPGLQAADERGMSSGEADKAERKAADLEKQIARKRAARQAVEHDIEAAQDDLYHADRQEYQRKAKELRAEAVKEAEQTERALKEYLASKNRLIGLWKRGIELQRAEAAAVNDSGFADYGIGNTGVLGLFRHPERAIALRADVITCGKDSLWAMPGFRPASMKEALLESYETPEIVPGRSIPDPVQVTHEQSLEIAARIADGEHVTI